MFLNNMSSVQKKIRLSYSRKKKCSTQKVKIIIDVETEEILSYSFCDGRTHYFRLFKEGGFLFLQMQDIREFQKFTKTAELRSKGKSTVARSEEEKKENRDPSKQRISITIEHIFKKIKTFRILEKNTEIREKGSVSGSILLPLAVILQLDQHDSTYARGIVKQTGH